MIGFLRSLARPAFALACSSMIVALVVSSVVTARASRETSGRLQEIATQGVSIATEVSPSGTPPPPYTDPSIATTNALGGLGRSQAWGVSTNNAGARDVLSATFLHTDSSADVQDTSTTTNLRYVTVKWVCGSGTACAALTNEAVCVRLGPNANGGGTTLAPALGCPNPDVADISTNASTGGCYLTAIGESCTFQLRPITSCASYAACKPSLWARASTASTVNAIVNVSVFW